LIGKLDRRQTPPDPFDQYRNADKADDFPIDVIPKPELSRARW
jgi:hypothetical protein